MVVGEAKLANLDVRISPLPTTSSNGQAHVEQDTEKQSQPHGTLGRDHIDALRAMTSVL